MIIKITNHSHSKIAHLILTGCHQYAEYLVVAKRDSPGAFEVFQSCCNEMEFSESCLALGNMYLTGKGK